jgi:hypothetical protein
MTARPLALIAAAAMAGSFFLPWLPSPLGADLVPWDAFQGLDSAQIQDFVFSLPPEGMAFLASFVLAALLVLLGLMGASPRLLIFVTGAIPVGMVGWALYLAVNRGNAFGLPVSSTDVMQIAQELAGQLGIGAWAWIGGGALLFLIGLFAPAPAAKSSRW